jgi:uncharacterized membrane protein
MILNNPSRLLQEDRAKIALFLFGMSAFCFSMSVFRFMVSGTPLFLFLNWNLFLAFIPWAAATIISKWRRRDSKFTVVFLITVWILFFPNSPYILTDLFHLHQRSIIPVWFDLILILSFAWTGLAFGFISLVDIEKALHKFVNPVIARASISIMLFAAAFGVYLGRYQRWNSWDIVSDPLSLISDVTGRFLDPFSHPRTWGMTILMGILLNMIYWTFKFLQSGRERAIL